MFDWITGFIRDSGYIGIVGLMLAENLFPPIPSELIMPLAGFEASKGGMSLFLIILAGTVGSVLGAYFWYLVGLWFGIERLKRWANRYGRWITLSPGEIDKAEAWFNRHAGAAVLFGRLVPGVRTLISVPAGLARMPVWRFLLYTTIGSAFWCSLLTISGYVLGSAYEGVAKLLDPLSTVVVAVLGVYYIYRVITFRPQPAPAMSSEPRPDAERRSRMR